MTRATLIPSKAFASNPAFLNVLAFDAGMFGEFNLTEILSCNDINTLKSEIDSVEYEYYRMTEEEQRLTDKTTRQLQGYFLGTTS